MISKKFFLEVMNTLQEMEKQIDTMNKALRECWTIDSDWFGPEALVNNHIYTYLIKAMEMDLCPDNADEDWISWWIFETEFGTNGLQYVYWGSKSYVIETAEDLWNFLADLRENDIDN